MSAEQLLRDVIGNHSATLITRNELVLIAIIRRVSVDTVQYNIVVAKYELILNWPSIDQIKHTEGLCTQEVEEILSDFIKRVKRGRNRGNLLALYDGIRR